MTTRERVIQCIEQARDAAVASPSLIAITGAVADALLAAGLIATPEERECVEACVAWRKGHNDIGQMDFNTLVDRKLCAAVDALLAARAPNPAWRVHEHNDHCAVGPSGEQRWFYKSGGLPDPDTCAREVARINAEAK